MCFVNDDYEWTASVVEHQTITASKDTRCMECYRPIPTGAPLYTTYMQEHEECGDCENGECACPDEPGCCACESPSLGETFDYHRCHECELFLNAVEAAEIGAGCERSESLPPYEGMIEYLREGGSEEARKYFELARVVYPELAASGYLGWLWKKLFSDEEDFQDEDGSHGSCNPQGTPADHPG